MYESIHEITLQIIGQVPIEMEFVYGICDISLFIIIVLCAISPIIFLYKMIG